AQTVTAIDGRWFASTCSGIEVLDCRLQRERRFRGARGCCGQLHSLSGKLLWVDRGAAFQSSPCCPAWSPVGSDVAKLPASFEPVRVGRTSYLFADHDKQGGSLWSLLKGRLVMVAEYDRDPWFRRSAR